MDKLMLEPEYGIKDLREVIEFVLSLGNAIGKSLADGKPDYLDAVYFLEALGSAPFAFIGITNVYREFRDLDPFEREELCAMIEENYSVDSTEIEMVINKALTSAIALMDVVQCFCDMDFSDPGSYSDG